MHESIIVAIYLVVFEEMLITVQNYTYHARKTVQDPT